MVRQISWIALRDLSDPETSNPAHVSIPIEYDSLMNTISEIVPHHPHHSHASCP
jgi:hypothetical protein